MPRRARPADRARIEAALPLALRSALEEMRELFDVQDWTLTPLAAPYQFAACMTMAANLVRDAGTAPTDALYLAADRLGLERETVRSWARRWPAASRGQSARAPTPSTPASLIRDAASALTTDEAA